MGWGWGRAGPRWRESQHRHGPGRERAKSTRDETARGWRAREEPQLGERERRREGARESTGVRRKVKTGSFLSVAKVPAHVCMYF